MSWQQLRQAAIQHNLTKSSCQENGVTFRSLSEAEKTKHDVRDVLLLEGERLRTYLHGNQDGRKAADCLFLVRKVDGSILVVVVELKSGRVDTRSFVEQYEHSVEDLRRFFARTGAGPLPTPNYATPRFPVPLAHRQSEVNRKLTGFRVKHALAEVLG